MKNIFGQDGLLYRAVTRAAELAVLNLLFLLTCIPVVTIGAARTALYSVTLRMCRKEESYLVRSYLKYFRENLRKATGIWLICGIVILVFAADFMILLSFTGEAAEMLRVPVLAAALLACMVMSYLFPLTAWFDNTVPNTFRNALIIAMTRIGYTLPVTAVNLLPAVLLALGGKPALWALRIWLVLGFALGAYVNSFLFRRVFERYM